MEHTESVSNLKSELLFDSMCSIRIRSRNRDSVEKPSLVNSIITLSSSSSSSSSSSGDSDSSSDNDVQKQKKRARRSKEEKKSEYPKATTQPKSGDAFDPNFRLR